MTCRLGSFAAVCARSFLARRVSNSLYNFSAPIHSSLLRLDDAIEIKMPSLSPTMTEGTIVKWLKKEGDVVNPGDVLCEIQTDKAVVGLETEEEGVLLKILMPEDSQNVPLGEVIAVIGSEGSTYEPSKKKPAPVPATPSPAEALTVKALSLTHQHPASAHRLIGPSVRKLLQEYDISFESVTPSGPQKNVLKWDILKFIATNNLKPKALASEPEPAEKAPVKVPKGAFVDVELTSMRKTIARRLSESKGTIPHAYVSSECSVAQIINLRKKLKNDGISVSVNDFVIKSVARALHKVPAVNVINVSGKAFPSQSIDISVAVATENGLITPIVKNANTLSIQQISETVRSLANRAREGKLRIEEFQGGSFTISNLGMFGIREFSAVINPPQCAILAVGGVRLAAGENEPVQKMTVTLSYDCSLIDGMAAGQFLEALKSYLENPNSILL